jgi:hypothetical protein
MQNKISSTCRGNCPAVRLSWYDAIELANLLFGQQGSSLATSSKAKEEKSVGLMAYHVQAIVFLLKKNGNIQQKQGARHTVFLEETS